MPYKIMSSSEAMPNSCWGRYRRVAIVETTSDSVHPKMISTHARGIVRIVHEWRRLNATTNGPNTAYAIAMRDAHAMLRHLEQFEIMGA